MTTNKPEVLGYCIKKDREPWDRPNGYYLSPKPDENYTVPLIRLSEYEALQAEFDALRAKTSMSIGVGDGSGNLFVHGDYDSIKRVQELIFESEKLRKFADQYQRLIELGEDFHWENIIRVDIEDFPSRADAITAALQPTEQQPTPELSKFLEKEEWNDAFAQGFSAGFNSDEKPEPDVSALVNALESLLKGYESLLEGGINRITHFDGSCDLIPDMLRDARAALTNHCKKGA